MKKFNIKKEHICTALTVVYHMTFLGGATTLGNHYLDEIEKTRKTIVEQVDRAEAIVKQADGSAKGFIKSANKVNDRLVKELKKVKKVCRL